MTYLIISHLLKGLQSNVSRRWLSIVSTRVFLRMTDREVACGLCVRTLLREAGQACRRCGGRRSLMHDDTCSPHGPNATGCSATITLRRRSFRGSKRSPGVIITDEPTSRSCRRNDIRWETGHRFMLLGGTEYGGETTDFEHRGRNHFLRNGSTALLFGSSKSPELRPGDLFQKQSDSLSRRSTKPRLTT